MTEKRTHVVVIGGGYAGTLAANHLRLRADVDITLVNPRPKFVERIRLHQLVAGNRRAPRPTTARCSATASSWSSTAPPGSTPPPAPCELASGRTRCDYDYLIYAVGSTGAMPASVPGAAEFAYPIAEFEQAQRLRDSARRAAPGAPVTVVGAGLTGDRDGRRAGRAGPRGHAGLRRTAGPVAVRAGPSVGRQVAAPSTASRCSRTTWWPRSARTRWCFADGAVRPSAVTIWTAGFGVPELAAASGLRTDALGRLLTDETLTSVDDAASSPPATAPHRRACRCG